jgi:hypothetical protein
LSREEEGDRAPSSCGKASRFLATMAALLLTRLASDMFYVLCGRGSGSGDSELAEGWGGGATGTPLEAGTAATWIMAHGVAKVGALGN